MASTAYTPKPPTFSIASGSGAREPRSKIRRLVYRCLIVASVIGVITAPAWDKPTIIQRKFRRLSELTNPDINESSGLAISHRWNDVYWTHNDSGDGARIFAFDRSGKGLGTCELMGARAIDWEDMVSFERGGKSWLLLADVGDNALDRPTYTLYLCEEPSPSAGQVSAQAIEFRYEDGPHNCESIGVDAVEGRVFLAIKVFSSHAKIYALPLPEKKTDAVLVAKSIASAKVPFATGMDISPDRRHAILLTYSDAFQFERGENETWEQAFAKAPAQLTMPIRRQGESICYGSDSQTLYLTSEKLPCPLWEVMPEVITSPPKAESTRSGND